MVAAARSGRTRSAPSRRAKVWRPARQLALSVRFIGGESTGSYTRRLANANGIPDEEFWAMFGTSVRKDGCPSDPRYGDGYVNAEALERLAVMSGRQVTELQFALPNLRPHRLLPDESGPVWDWPWDDRDCFLVRMCEMCAHVKGTGLLAYLASDAPWQVCAVHQRWLDNRREPGTAAIPLRRLPEVVYAHQQRLLFERRLGAGGRALFADAYAIVSLWWNIRALNAPVWRERQLVLGRAGRDGLRVAPLVFYPEAVSLAQALATRERRRLRGTLTLNDHHRWLARVASLMDRWGIPDEPGLDPVERWADRHPPLTPRRQNTPLPVERPARGRFRRLPVADGTHVLHAPLGKRSCLKWQLGELLTNELQPALGGWTVDGRA
ncbi:hypothetical protein ABZX65_23770 [Streptomyces sp. NPDC003300]|uniref:hypothetical protein n=1 Tax=unclassified Streptomyces TaxID=2593676 RepID=UPI0033A5AC4B